MFRGLLVCAARAPNSRNRHSRALDNNCSNKVGTLLNSITLLGKDLINRQLINNSLFPVNFNGSVILRLYKLKDPSLTISQRHNSLTDFIELRKEHSKMSPLGVYILEIKLIEPLW